MYTLIKVGFEYKDSHYDALIRVKQKTEGIDYEITVMNGDLEKLLYGNHIIKLRNERLLNEHTEPTEHSLLKSAITGALSNFLSIPVEDNILEPAGEICQV